MRTNTTCSLALLALIGLTGMTSAQEVVNPLPGGGAPDPFVTYDVVSGYYYNLSTDTAKNGEGLSAARIVLRRSRHAATLRQGEEKVVYTTTPADRTLACLWAPEMHRAPDGRWYIWSSAAVDEAHKNKRIFVLESKTTEPFDGFVFKGFPDPDFNAIDPTVTTFPDGRMFACISPYDVTKHEQWLEIRELKTPWSYGTKRADIAHAELPWELVPPYDKNRIVEGPFFLRSPDSKRLFIIYSANGCWSDDYALGVLEYQGGDPCRKEAWKKSDEPLFRKGNGVYGTGHASFFKSPDGTETWCAYHSLASSDPQAKPMARYMNLQKISFTKDGYPVMGEPVKPGEKRPAPSGDDRAATWAASYLPPMSGEEPIWRTRGLLPQLEWNGTTNDPEPADKTDRFLPASLASEPEPDAAIVYRDGLPKISLNGKLYEPILNMSDMNYKWGLNQGAKMQAMGVTFNQIIFRLNDFEVKPGVYSFGRMEAYVKRLLKYVPEARILAAIELVFPKWTAAHPEAQIGYADGPAEGLYVDDHRGRAIRPSAASKEYRAEVRHFFEELAKYLADKPWAKRIVAIRPSWGIYKEWHTFGMYHAPDCGPAMTAAFRRYKNGLYANESVPTLEERTFKEAFFFDPAAHQKLVDYYDCMANETADFLIEASREVKRLLPGRLVGAYYGYVLATHPPEGATALAEKVLASGAVDFMSNPAEYNATSRLAGGAYYLRSIPATFQRYRKLLSIEDDMRHYPIGPFTPQHRKITTRNPREAVMTTRRNMLNAWFDACGIQFLDCNSHREVRIFTHDAPEICQAIQDVRALAPMLGPRPSDSGNRVAVVLDPLQRFRRPSNHHGEYDAVYRNSIEGYYASGVPADFMTLNDFLAAPKGRYNAAVFLNLFSAEPATLAQVAARADAKGFKSAWMLKSALGEARKGRAVLKKVPCDGTSWQRLLTALGAPAVAPAGHYVRRHGDRLMFHTGKVGTWTLTLPAGYTGAKELFSQRAYAGASFDVTTDGPDTLVFQLTK